MSMFGGKTLKLVPNIPKKIKTAIRNKAIDRARTRIIVAGRKVEDLSEEDLEVVVAEEEEKLITNYKEKGLLAIIGILGLGLWM